MSGEFWIAAASTATALGIAWLVHVKLVGWMPEDAPNARRKRHTRAIPLAGIVPALASITLCAVHGFAWLAIGAGVAAMTGLIDDRNKEDGDGIDWRAKAAGLTIAALCALAHIWIHHDLGWFELGCVGLFVFVVANAVNFLDNAHGVSTVLGGLALVWIGGPAASIGACWLAFLPFNWPHGRLFLGDSGALSLGLLAGSFAVGHAAANGSIDWIAAVIPVAVFCLDFVQVVTARVILGYAPWVADRRHLTHIIGNLGVRHELRAPILTGVAAAVLWLAPSIT